MLNNANNKLTFEVTSGGLITYPEGSLLNVTGGPVVNFERPSIEKTVTNSNGAETNDPNTDVDETIPNFDRNSPINYQIQVPLPQNIGTYSKFEITDTAPEGISIDTTTIAVAGLTPVDDYTITSSASSFTISLTATGLTKLAQAKEADNTFTLDITYTASITGTVTPGTDLTNTATLTYINGEGGAERYDNDTATVTTLGRKFSKQDDGLWNSGIVQQGLAGAEFIVERTGENGTEEYLAIAENGVYSWTPTQADAYVFTSGQDGAFEVVGLAAGTYRLIETKAPTGFRLPIGEDAVTEFTIDASSYGLDALEILNERTPDMPMTGSERLVIFSSLALVLVLALLILAKRRKQEEN